MQACISFIFSVYLAKSLFNCVDKCDMIGVRVYIERSLYYE